MCRRCWEGRAELEVGTRGVNRNIAKRLTALHCDASSPCWRRSTAPSQDPQVVSNQQVTWPSGFEGQPVGGCKANMEQTAGGVSTGAACRAAMCRFRRQEVDRAFHEEVEGWAL